MDEQLIILGNGFDLACGLKSSYKDFFEYRYGTDEEKNDIAQSIDQFFSDINDSDNININTLEADVSIWDIIFYKYVEVVKETWTDVETTILTYLPKFRDTHRAYNNVIEVSPFEKYKTLKRSEPYLEFWFYIYEKYKSKNELNFEQIKIVLLHELNNFEAIFAEYLHEQLFSNSPESKLYVKHSKKLLKELEYLDLYPNKGDRTSKILSFNYTRVPEILSGEDFAESYRNVHGLTWDANQSDIIFGVDLHSLENSKDGSFEARDFLEFTKTYRTLQLISHQNFDFDVISENTKFVKFYGHGLGEADYSYFLSIFDAVDLYSSQTKLFFYFSVDSREDYKKSTDEEKKLIRYNEEQNQFEKVTGLIDRYASTLSNDHNENLLHKLILENRIRVVEIRTEDIVDF